MVCPRCGAQIDGQSMFCATCGARIPEALLPPPPAESSAPPTWPSTPPPPAPAAPRAWSQATKGLNTASVVLGLGALLIGIGSFLPWINFSIVSASRSGLDGGDGIITLAICIVLVLVAFTNFSRSGLGPSSRALSLLGGLGAIAIAIYDGIGVSNQIAGISSVDVSGSVGIGLFVVGIGGGVAVWVALFGASHGSAATV